MSLDWDTIQYHITPWHSLSLSQSATRIQLQPILYHIHPYQQKIVQLFWINMQSDRTRKSDPHSYTCVYVCVCDGKRIQCTNSTFRLLYFALFYFVFAFQFWLLLFFLYEIKEIFTCFNSIWIFYGDNKKNEKRIIPLFERYDISICFVSFSSVFPITFLNE